MSKRANPEINAGSMADIAFLLLIFFLVTTTMNVDSGIMRGLPAIQENEVEVQQKKRNILFVSLNSRDEIMLGLTKLIPLSELKDKAKEFILNRDGDPEMPEMQIKTIPGLGNIRVSSAIISLQNHNSTSYDIYVKVQNELTKAYNEIREECSLRYFGRPLARLEKEEFDAIRLAVPMVISEADPKY